jgi:hypothetical protein
VEDWRASRVALSCWFWRNWTMAKGTAMAATTAARWNLVMATVVAVAEVGEEWIRRWWW